MDPRWRIELQGGLRAQRGSQAHTRFQTRKTAALLAYLAFHLDRPHPREILIELLWPECDPLLGRNSLRVALTSLRHQLEPPGEPALPAGSVLIADHHAVRLSGETVATDVREFEDALRRADRASSSFERSERLAEAVDRYRGELLPGYYEEWIEPERQRLSECFLGALRELAGLLATAGEPRRAIKTAQRAAIAAPWHEDVHRVLMRLLADAGQPAAALQHYRELERRLRDEMGAAPSAATRAIAAELQQQPASIAECGVRSAACPDPGPQSAIPNPHSSLPTGTVTYLLADLPTEPGHPDGAIALAIATLRRAFQTRGNQAREFGGCFELAFRSAGEALANAECGMRNAVRPEPGLHPAIPNPQSAIEASARRTPAFEGAAGTPHRRRRGRGGE